VPLPRLASFCVLSLLAVSPLVAAQRDEAASGPPPPAQAVDPLAPAGWVPPASPLYDNGPLSNSPGTGVGGADESRLQFTDLNMTTLGYGHQVALEARLADDFVVPPGTLWRIDHVTFFGYQTGSPTASTFTSLNFRIWRGAPDQPGSVVVFGDTTSDRLLSSEWTGVLRVREQDSGLVADRPIMANRAQAGVTLDEGTYWLDFQADGSLTSGPWCPPVILPGQAETGNAIQANDGTTDWEEIVDGGSEAPQGLPFLLEGEAIGTTAPAVPTLSTGLLAAFAALLLSGGLFLLRRRGRS
jgi:hypothetical protein